MSNVAVDPKTRTKIILYVMEHKSHIAHVLRATGHQLLWYSQLQLFTIFHNSRTIAGSLLTRVAAGGDIVVGLCHFSAQIGTAGHAPPVIRHQVVCYACLHTTPSSDSSCQCMHRSRQLLCRLAKRLHVSIIDQDICGYVSCDLNPSD